MVTALKMTLLDTATILLALLCIQSAVLFAQAQVPPTGTQCTPVPGSPGCVCDLPTGERIDLTAVANSDGTPKYSDGLVDPNNYIYFFNPCHTFSSDTSGCENVFVCQQEQGGAVSYDIADGTEEIWVDGDKTYLYYTGPQARDTRVYLNCDEGATGNPTVTTDGDSAVTLSYVFHMTSSYACPGGGGGAGGGAGDIAGAIGLVLIFLCLGALVAYFVIGAVIMKFKFQASGTDIIPNKGFWLAFPLLIKDGFMFTISPCVNLIHSKRGYQKT